MTLENDMAPLLYYDMPSASFQSHGSIQIGVTVRKRWIPVKICHFSSHVTLKSNIWHLFSDPSSCVHHFLAIGEFELELLSGNTQFGQKMTIILVVWPWNLADDLDKQKGASAKQHQAFCIISSYVKSNLNYSPETAKLGFDLLKLLTV